MSSMAIPPPNPLDLLSRILQFVNVAEAFTIATPPPLPFAASIESAWIVQSVNIGEDWLRMKTPPPLGALFRKIVHRWTCGAQVSSTAIPPPDFDLLNDMVQFWMSGEELRRQMMPPS